MCPVSLSLTGARQVCTNNLRLRQQLNNSVTWRLLLGPTKEPKEGPNISLLFCKHIFMFIWYCCQTLLPENKLQKFVLNINRPAQFGCGHLPANSWIFDAPKSSCIKKFCVRWRQKMGSLLLKDYIPVLLVWNKEPSSWYRAESTVRENKSPSFLITVSVKSERVPIQCNE